MELFLTVCVTSVTLGLLYSLFALGLRVVDGRLVPHG